jgi:hypothetical protein
MRFCFNVLLLYSLPIIDTTTIAKKNLNSAEKKVVICQIIGKLKIPNSPNSRVRKPKKLIFTADNRMQNKGNKYQYFTRFVE